MKNTSKRNGKFCALAAAALLLGGCAQGQGKMAYIGADAAKKQILAEVGLDESQVTINSVDMATKNGMDYYRVEFSDADGNVYRYDIEALTGKVIESAAQEAAAAMTETTAAATQAMVTENAAEAGSQQTAQPAQTAKQQAQTSDAAGGTKLTAEEAKTKALAHAGISAAEATFTKADPDRDDGRQVYDVEFYGGGKGYEYEIDAYSGEVLSVDIDLSLKPAQLTAETAKEKALAHAGLSASQVTFIRTEADHWDDGRATYEIEFYGTDGTEYEYEIDANSGDVLKYDIDAPSRTLEQPPSDPSAITPKTSPIESNSSSAPASTYMDAEAAKQLALTQVPGATASDIAEFETDRDDGRIEYEGKIYYGGMEYEFEIDAYSGAFRKWECEYDDDHHGSHHIQ